MAGSSSSSALCVANGALGRRGTSVAGAAAPAGRGSGERSAGASRGWGQSTGTSSDSDIIRGPGGRGDNW